MFSEVQFKVNLFHRGEELLMLLESVETWNYSLEDVHSFALEVFTHTHTTHTQAQCISA